MIHPSQRERNNLARVWRLARRQRFIAMTAFLPSVSDDENLQRNRALVGELRSSGLGVWILEGSGAPPRWRPGDPHARDPCLFVPLPERYPRELEVLIQRLLSSWDLRAAVFKPSPAGGLEVFTPIGTVIPWALQSRKSSSRVLHDPGHSPRRAFRQRSSSARLG